jgi:hypothetical protein
MPLKATKNINGNIIDLQYRLKNHAKTAKSISVFIATHAK